MKRVVMLFTLVVALGLLLSAAAGEETAVLSEAYRMMAGRVSFTFPVST